MGILFPARELNVLDRAQVCVIGGGTAGIAAAAAAAKNGADTLLIEKNGYLGGTTTAGMVCIWHLSDGEKQVVRGVAQELLERFPRTGPGAVSVTPGYPVLPGEKADKSHEFDAETAKRVFESYLTDAGVRLLCYTTVAGVIRDGGRIQALAVVTKRGLQAVCANEFIDCSGDGSVAAFAGCPFAYGRESDGRVQGMTMVYSLKNVDAEKCREYTFHSPKGDAVAAEMARERDAGRFPPFGGIDFYDVARGFHANMNPIAGDPLDERSLTACTLETRRRIDEYLAFFREHVPGYENAALDRCADEIGIRESRRILGDYVFTKEDVLAERRFPDAVGHGFWCVDIHDPKGSGSTTWDERSPRKAFLPKGHSYQIPYRVLVPKNAENLLVAGRCVSADHEGIASLRIQSACMVMGQAAGTAAAICAESGRGVREVPIGELRRRLREQGVYLEES